MSSPVGLMRPHASHRKSKLLEDMTARVLNASQPKPPEELLALMSEAHRSQIEELAKLVLRASKVSGLDYYDTATSMWPAMSDERRGLIAHVLQQASPLALEPTQPKPRSDAAASVVDEWAVALAPSNATFMDRLIASESSGDASASYTTRDGRSFVGQLQFGQARLSDYQRATGEAFTQDEFKADLPLQKRVAEWHFAEIDKAIDALGEAALGYDRDGLKAVAHLGGVTGMQRFVKTQGQYDPSDELGTSLSDYYGKFSSKQS